jgi:hypothetical protein
MTRAAFRPRPQTTYDRALRQLEGLFRVVGKRSEQSYLQSPYTGRTNFLVKSRKPAWILAPRPGLEPGTCGLTVYGSIKADQLVSSFFAPQNALKSLQIVEFWLKLHRFCGAKRSAVFFTSRQAIKPSTRPRHLLVSLTRASGKIHCRWPSVSVTNPWR